MNKYLVKIAQEHNIRTTAFSNDTNNREWARALTSHNHHVIHVLHETHGPRPKEFHAKVSHAPKLKKSKYVGD